MQRKVFVATGVIALAGGLGTAALSSSCDQDCTLEARASVIMSVTQVDGSALQAADIDRVWYRVTDEPAPRSAGDDLVAPDSEWKTAECYDEACTRFVLGYETPGFYDIRASVCGQTHTARAVVDMTADGCHVDTEEIELMVDGEGCTETEGPTLTSPAAPECTLEARPSMVIELFDPDKGTAYEVRGDNVYAIPEGESTPLDGTCLNEHCSIWSIGLEQAGEFTVHADVCGEATEMDVSVGMTTDGCHVDTRYELMEVDSSSCPLPFTAEIPDPGPTCDRMARPSAIVFPVQDFGDVWAPVDVDAIWYEYRGKRYEPWCYDGDCSIDTYVVGWEQHGRFKVHAEVCGEQFSIAYTVHKTEDGCHVQTEYVPLFVDKEACPGPH